MDRAAAWDRFEKMTAVYFMFAAAKRTGRRTGMTEVRYDNSNIYQQGTRIAGSRVLNDAHRSGALMRSTDSGFKTRDRSMASTLLQTAE